MSALMTGFSKALIAPPLDPIGLPATFFQTASDNGGPDFQNLIGTFNGLKGQGISDSDIGQILMGLAPDPITHDLIPDNQTALIKAIMKLWYLGSWYQPFELNGVAKDTQTVVSDQAYIKGLAWQSMQSHAMGNSTFTFGYWHDDPGASLQLTTGNPDTTGEAAS